MTEYNKKLKDIAEDMAERSLKRTITIWDIIPEESRLRVTKEKVDTEPQYLDDAAMLLEKMAEAYNQGWVNSIEEMRERDCDFPMSGLDTPRPDKEPEYYLKSLGLIP